MFSLQSSFFSMTSALAGRLDGKVSLVTGAAAGLGCATAEALFQEGSAVIFSDVVEKYEVMERIKQMNKERKNSAMFIKLDVSKEEDWKNCMNVIEKKYGKLNCTVNNAHAKISKAVTIEDETVEGFLALNSINALGVFLGSKHSIPLMRKEGGSIVNLSFLGVPQLASYNASKGAVRAMSKSIAFTMAKKKYNIRCNCILPAYVQTPTTESWTKSGQATKEFLASLHPVGRLGKAEEIAAGVVYLASDDAAFVTGTELVIDGGYSSKQ